jgi:hypothetical protein
MLIGGLEINPEFLPLHQHKSPMVERALCMRYWQHTNIKKARK